MRCRFPQKEEQLKKSIPVMAMKSAVLAIAVFMSSCELNESWYTDLAPGDAKTVEIAAMGQHVYRVHFPIAADYTIAVSQLTSDFGLSMYHYDESAQKIDELVDEFLVVDDFSDSTGESILARIEQPAYYFIIVNELDNVPGSYRITFDYNVVKNGGGVQLLKL